MIAHAVTVVGDSRLGVYWYCSCDSVSSQWLKTESEAFSAWIEHVHQFDPLKRPCAHCQMVEAREGRSFCSTECWYAHGKNLRFERWFQKCGQRGEGGIGIGYLPERPEHHGVQVFCARGDVDDDEGGV